MPPPPAVLQPFVIVRPQISMSQSTVLFVLTDRHLVFFCPSRIVVSTAVPPVSGSQLVTRWLLLETTIGWVRAYTPGRMRIVSPSPATSMAAWMSSAGASGES